MRRATPPAAIGTAVHAPATPAPRAIAAAELAAREESAVLPAVPRDDQRGRAIASALVPANDRKAESAAPVAQVAPVVAPQAAIAVAPRAPRVRHTAAAPSTHTSTRVERAQTSAPLSFGSQEGPDQEAPAQAVSTVDRGAPPAAPAQSKVVDDSLAREIALLKRARAALDRKDPRAALAITDEYAAQFASGVMRQERLATRVLALCALHRRADAVDAKHELERIAPRSPHLMRLRTSCAAENDAHEVK
jgi:hypothetical protein